MNKYYLRKLACSALGLLLAFSIVGFVMGVSVVALFQNNSFVEKRVNKNQNELIEIINDDLLISARELRLSSNAFDGAVNESNIGVVTGEIAKNIMYSYTTDFSEMTELYNIVAGKYSEYVSKNHLTYTSKKINMDTSYAVNSLSETLYSEDTANIALFKLVHKRLALYLVTASVIFIVGCCIALELINKGRHRKFSYIGMGVVTSGYLMTLVPIFLLLSGIVKKYKFAGFNAYQQAVVSCIQDALRIAVIFGVAAIIAGVILLAYNYNYFKKKTEKAKESREINKKLREEYLDKFPKQERKPRAEGEEFEKDIMTIDFEEE